jgi:crotonobetainyl-CoA:carnitine CoA-transferase CaiB-like acyl-CoA transferase
MGPPMFDYIAGIYGAFAILAAIKERDRTGLGHHLDVAMLDAALVSMASFSSRHLNGGRDVVANGNTAGSGSPASGIFPTREGMLAVAANNERQVRQFCGAMGEPNLLEDARFNSLAAREKNAKLFGQAIIERLATRSASEWEDAMAKAHVPAAKVRTLNEVLHEPQVIARGVQQEMIDPKSGKSVFVPTIGFKWNGQPLGPERMPPRLGADADSVLAELGLDAVEVAALRAAGAVLGEPG